MSPRILSSILLIMCLSCNTAQTNKSISVANAEKDISYAIFKQSGINNIRKNKSENYFLLDSLNMVLKNIKLEITGDSVFVQSSLTEKPELFFVNYHLEDIFIPPNNAWNSDNNLHNIPDYDYIIRVDSLESDKFDTILYFRHLLMKQGNYTLGKDIVPTSIRAITYSKAYGIIHLNQKIIGKGNNMQFPW